MLMNPAQSGQVYGNRWHRRGMLEHRYQGLAEQQRLWERQGDRRQELAGLASGIEEFCRRV
jgi:hypothetical protein